MRNVRFDFIDENFGEKVECVLIWDDNSFILITLMENKIKIKEYEEIEELEDKIKWLKLKRKQ